MSDWVETEHTNYLLVKLPGKVDAVGRTIYPPPLWLSEVEMILAQTNNSTIEVLQIVPTVRQFCQFDGRCESRVLVHERIVIVSSREGPGHD